MSWPDLQAAFAAALADPHAAPPQALATPGARAPHRRFAVYRNNVAASLGEALAASFPVVAALVGEARFRHLAHAYRDARPPRSPVLGEFGAGFADALASHEIARDLPYLADIARLEWARLSAYHAADAAPASIAELSALAPEALPALRLALHPAARLVASPWPIVSIWQAHQEDDPRAVLARIGPGGEDALVTRPDMAVELRRLGPGVAVFAAAIADGRDLAAAAEAGSAAAAGFDLAGGLADLFAAGAFAGVAG